MDNEYWTLRWERDETGWHQADVEPALVAQFSDQTKPFRVFVPLCGKTLDMVWLLGQGYEVVGVELSPVACEQFFKINQIPYELSTEGSFHVYRGGKITIFQGDFFLLSSEILGKIDAVYDRAALIALSLDLRPRYSLHMIGLIRDKNNGKDVRFLQIIIERIPTSPKGPPFTVTEEQMRALYESDFEISRISREEVERGTNSELMVESVFRLTLKAHPTKGP